MTKKLWLRSVLLLVVLAAFYFLYQVYAENRSVIADWRMPNGGWLLGAGLAITYAGLLWLLAEAWHRLLGANVARTVSHASFLGAQLGKYIPGGVVHLVGRHSWLAGKGVNHKKLLKAAFWEALAMILVASLIACALLVICAGSADASLTIPFIGRVANWTIAMAGVGAFAGLVVLQHVMNRDMGASVWPVFGLIALFFIGQTVLFLMCAAAVLPSMDIMLAPAFLLAWVIGFIVIGAPGGLGVREAALVALTGGHVSPGDALLIGALFRLLSMAGEGCGYLIALMLLRSDRHEH